MGRKKISLLCIFFLAGIILGCGEKEKTEKTEIVIINGWGMMDEDHQIMRDIYEDFQENNPDITLKLISMPSSDKVIEKAKEMLSVGKVPDLIFTGGIGHETLYRFMVEKGYALDLMPYIREDEEFEKCISPAAFGKWETDEGKMYTISDVLLMCGYWYNEQIFQEAGIGKLPSTWEEFVECCEQIRLWAEREKLNTVPLHLDPETSMYLINAYMAGKTDGKSREYPLGADKELFEEALGELKKLEKYSEYGDYTSTYLDNMSNFNVGHTAICVNGVWAEKMLHPNLKASYALFPTTDGEEMAAVSSCLGYIVGKTGNVEKQDACVKFLKYMLSEPVQARILKDTSQVPASPLIDMKDYKNQCPFRLYRAIEKVNEADTFFEIPANSWTESSLDYFKQKMYQVFTEEVSIEAFVENMEKSK